MRRASTDVKPEATPATTLADEAVLTGGATEVQTTPSGVVLRHQESAVGTALQATLPAGVLLPFPMVLRALQNGDQSQVQAHIQGDESRPLQAGFTHDGRVFVNPDPDNPHAPLVMFNPGSNDYGLVSKSQKNDDGSTVFHLQETVHADGSQTMVQNHRIGADGSRSFNQVDQDAAGGVEARAVRMTADGQTSQTPLRATLGDRSVSLEGMPSEAPRSLMDHARDSLKTPFTLRSPLLDWLKDKKKAAEVERAQFMTFSTAMGAFRASGSPVKAMQAFAPPGATPT